jgi:hypothetical protein
MHCVCGERIDYFAECAMYHQEQYEDRTIIEVFCSEECCPPLWRPSLVGRNGNGFLGLIRRRILERVETKGEPN